MAGTIEIQEKLFEPYLGSEQIIERVRDLARELAHDLEEKDPLFLAVLNGSFIFASDLMKELNMLCEISFVKFSSYQGTRSTGEVNSLIGINERVKGRNIVILEDIIDTGRTIDHLINDLQDEHPASIKVATLTFKRAALEIPIEPDYIGFEVPDAFLVGYGLDYNYLGRNLKDIYIQKNT